MKKYNYLIVIISTLMACNTSADKKSNLEQSNSTIEPTTSTFIEGAYNNKAGEHTTFSLTFQKDGFVYADIHSTIYEGKKEDENIFFNYSVVKMVMNNSTIFPQPNFYKYEKHGTNIYINFGDYGYYGLDCSNPNELCEIENQKCKWTKK